MYGRILFATVVLAFVASSAHAEPNSKVSIKCKAGILKASAAFSQARAKALAKCEEAVVKGKLAQSTDCATEAKTAVALAKANAKLQTSVQKACYGKDKSCATEDADGTQPTLADIGWNIGNCPNFENGTCSSPIANCNDIGTCLSCVAGAAVDQAIGLSYDGLATTDPKTQKVLNKCQIALGKANTAYLGARSKALQKCWEGLNKGKIPSCPDTKATAAIAKAEGKRRASACKACGGPNKACGGGDDIAPTDIGFPTACSDLDPPGAQLPCSNAIASLDDIVSCTGCVTNFKVDCVDQAAVPAFASYPQECNPAPVATPTPTVTPTLTPTVTATATPGVNCGNGMLDTGEDCDGSIVGAGSTCPNAGNGLEVCSANCTCACPGTIEFTGDALNPATILDAGWSGIAHKSATISDGTVTVQVTGCANPTRSPSCGVCDFTGPVPNANAGNGVIDNQRCSNNTSVRCTDATPCFQQCIGGVSDGAACQVGTCAGGASCTDGVCASGADAGKACCAGGACAAAGTCQFFFGSTLPLSSGGVSTCVVNQINGAISGTANVETGESASQVALISRVFSGILLTQPCPTCVGDAAANDGSLDGTCDGGARDGLACDENGTSPIAAFGDTSYDCPLVAGAQIATLPIALNNSTGTETRTLSANQPSCRAVGYAGNKCFCDTCNNAVSTPCTSNADCIAVGATICGGRRCLPGSGAFTGNPCAASSDCGGGTCNVPGQPTAPNGCPDGPQDCLPVAGRPNDGECQTGSDGVCSAETFRGCFLDDECRPASEGGTCADCAPGNQTCTQQVKRCFPDAGVVGGSVVAQGQADLPTNDTSEPTLASLFCIGPTTSGAVNLAAGLPGLGRVTLFGTANGRP